MKAIGVIESSSIARGFEICDAMAKASMVEILEASPICPGKFVIIIGGFVADVKSSIKAGIEIAGECLIDKLVIPNIDDQVFSAINGTTDNSVIDAIGIIETYSISSGISAADISVKAADVSLIEVRLSRGMGGKTFILMTGSVADVNSAVSSACEIIENDGLLASFSIIPSPHPDMIKYLF